MIFFTGTLLIELYYSDMQKLLFQQYAFFPVKASFFITAIATIAIIFRLLSAAGMRQASSFKDFLLKTFVTSSLHYNKFPRASRVLSALTQKEYATIVIRFFLCYYSDTDLGNRGTTKHRN